MTTGVAFEGPLAVLLGSPGAERVLLYLQNYGEGHAHGIATTFGVPVFGVQKHLTKFESGGILVSRLIGRTRLYTWNPRYSLESELRALLARSLDFVPPDDQLKFFRQRRRPRRPGKTL
jgi:hypothetical protein